MANINQIIKGIIWINIINKNNKILINWIICQKKYIAAGAPAQ